MNYQKNIFSLLKYFANLQLAIFLLLLISGLSILGTIIEQGQPLEFYKNSYPDTSILPWYIINGFGLDHIFYTYWFMSLLGIFVLSITTCTITRQLPILKLAKKIYLFSNNKIRTKQKVYEDPYTKTISNYLSELGFKNYLINFAKSRVYAYTGILGRFSPIIVHVSMLLILLGAFLGFSYGYTAQEMIPEYEYAHIQNLVATGYFSKLPNDLIINVKDFRIDYNNMGNPDQYYSRLALYKNDNKITEETIYVNKPLNYNGITIYQTDWNINSLRLDVNNQNIQIPLSSTINENKQKIWVGSLTPYNIDCIFVVKKLDGVIYIYNSDGKLINTVEENQAFEISTSKIKIQNVLVSTGLQIKSDPGLFIVYSGFFLLIFSSTFSYISFTQVWVTKKDDIGLISGTTNRSVLDFEKEFYLLLKNAKQDILNSKI